MKKRVLFYVGLPLIALFLLIGVWYVWAELKSRSGITFNHAFHDKTVGVGCELCHQQGAADPRFMSFPNHETCSACHADAIDEASPQKNCQLCHNLPGYVTQVRKNQVLSPLVRFDHRVHAEREVSCDSCHAVIDQEVLAADEMLPKMDTCIQCHAKRKVSEVKDCYTCHLKGYEKIAPPSHIANWVSVHGEGLTKEKIDVSCLACHQAKLAGSCTQCHHPKAGGAAAAAKAPDCALCHGKGFQTRRPKDHTPLWISAHGKNLAQARIDANCTLCHTARNGSDCLSCHRREAPKNHTVAWTVVSHGLKARLDRQSCSTCHDQSECVACHTTNPPFSHTGLWGSPFDRHCINCHMEFNNYASGPVGSNCSFCHQSADVYAAHKSLQKPGHFVGSDCTTCHKLAGGAGPNVRHPYPKFSAAAQCVSCHQ